MLPIWGAYKVDQVSADNRVGWTYRLSIGQDAIWPNVLPPLLMELCFFDFFCFSCWHQFGPNSVCIGVLVISDLCNMLPGQGAKRHVSHLWCQLFFSKPPSQEPWCEELKASEQKQVVQQGQKSFFFFFHQPMFLISQVVLVAQATLSLPEMTFKSTWNAWHEYNQYFCHVTFRSHVTFDPFGPTEPGRPWMPCGWEWPCE